MVPLSRAGLITALLLSPVTVHSAEQHTKLPGLKTAVEVATDDFGIPHIFAQNWTDAAQALGYLQARDRLWQMDMLRRRASGTTAEVIGKAGLDSDILMRQLGIRRGCEQLWQSNQIPAEMRDQLQAFAAGVNARIAEVGKDRLPLYFKLLGYEPAPWTPVDSLVFSKYMGWDQSGTNDDLWFGMMVEKMGVAAAEELWPLDRPYEEPTVDRPVERDALSKAAAMSSPRFIEACGRAFDRLARAGSLFRGLSFGSNNWAIDGSRSASGKPILANDPHLGFQLPCVWYAVHLSVAGKNVVGVTFPGSPGIVIGHNDRLGWGVTNMQADAVDYYVETINPDNPRQYHHKGQWRELKRVTERIAIRGQPEQVLDIDYTVHGPIVERGEHPIALCWTGLGPTTELIAFWQVQQAENLRQFLEALDKLTVPALNVVYADADGNIALYPCGALPLRMHGQGRIPMDGASGDSDWAGMIPRDELPLALNPASHFVASANNRPAGIGYPHYTGWMWDPSYRKRRIDELLAQATGVTAERMRAIQLDVYDKAAERFVPSLLDSLPANIADPLARRAREELARWDFVADGDALGPAIWLRWFSIYRQQVWDDEWSSRGIKQPHGSWGFTGLNRREPMLEVLEFLTREFPKSIWFDDRSTAQRETRDDIARRSFDLAIASLKNELGDDVSRWRWDRINTLYVGSLARQAELGRDGGPVPGTSFTVNPGGDIGRVGGGASFRLIVDFATPAQSLGVYPGGQSEDPASPHYADLIPLWAKGEYISLGMVGDRDKLPESARKNMLVLVP
jgi:penicillin amidase